MSNESGRNQVYVRSFPDGDRRLQVSTDGGTQPALSGNGREIFYRDPAGWLCSVAILFAAEINAEVERTREIMAGAQPSETLTAQHK